MNSDEKIISQTEFAREAGVSPQAIAAAIREGRFSPAAVVQTPRGKRLYHERARKEWAQISFVGKSRKPSSDGGLTLSEKKMIADTAVSTRRAEILDLQKRELSGELVRVEAVEREWVDVGTRIRNLLLAMPAVAAPQVDAIFAQKLRPAKRRAAIQELLEEKVTEALLSLGEDILKG